MTAQESPATFVLIEAADQAGVSVVAPKGADAELVTVDFRDTPAQLVFESIAAQLGLLAVLESSTVTFIADDQAARNLGVFRVAHHDNAQAVSALQAVVGSTARVISMGSSVVVAGSSQQVSKAAEFAPYLTTGPDGWRLEVRVVSISSNLRRDLGIDWEVGASVRAQLGGGNLEPNLTSGVAAAALVEAIARASEERNGASLLHSATLYVLEDGTAQMHQGERTPVPKFQTSPEGTTTTVGYEYVQTGFELMAGCKRVPGGARLTLEPSVSSVGGFVGDAPIVTQSRVNVQAVVRSGEWLVVSGLATTTATDGQSGIPGLPDGLGMRSSAVGDSQIVYLIRALRVHTGRPGG